MRSSGILFVSGLGLLFFGLFAITRARPCEPGSCGADANGIAYAFGLVLFSLAVARFGWLGWQGNGVAWLVAAPAAGVLTWTLYELVRQGVPLYGIGILGEMTAPTASIVVGLGVLFVGWLRRSDRPSDFQQR